MPTNISYNPENDIAITRGRGLSEVWYLRDEAGTPIPLTNYDICIQVRAATNGQPDPAGNLILECSRIGGISSKLTVDDTAGTFQLTFTSADADAFTAGGDYWWDGYLTPSGQQPEAIPSDGPGKWIVYERVAKIGGGA